MGFRANITNLIHQIVIGILFILNHVGVIKFESIVSIGIDVWAGLNLISMAILLMRRSFTTPKVVDVKCPKCQLSMETSTLTCKSCGSTFTIPTN